MHKVNEGPDQPDGGDAGRQYGVDLRGARRASARESPAATKHWPSFGSGIAWIATLGE